MQFNINIFGLHAAVELTRTAMKTGRNEREIREKTIYFEGDYPDWNTALNAAEGYDAPQILEKAVSAMRLIRDGKAKYERDTVLFDEIQLSYPLSSWLLYVASCFSGRLSVMDFGGALGSSYYQNRLMLEKLPHLSWSVVEQSDFVTAGIAEFQNDILRFFYKPEECVLAKNPNFLLLSSVLQYIENYNELLDTLLAKEIPYVLIDRTMAYRGAHDHLAVQHVPAWIYKASYPVWFIDADKLEECFERNGYDILDKFDPHIGSTFGLRDKKYPYIGWFLKKRGF
jgi:putative methyltransferase (TIGR04325 family)